MNLEQMKYLIDLSKTHSMTATANHFYRSQQSISESMKHLEQELQSQLFIRNSKGIVFTEAGKRVLAYAIQQVNDYTLLNRDLINLNNTDPIIGTLHIGIAPLAASVILKPLFMELNLTYPLITPLMQEIPYDTLLEQIQNQQLDFALFGDLPSEQYARYREDKESLLHFEKLYADELVCVMSPHNKLMDENVTLHMHTFQHVPQTIYSVSRITPLSTNVLHVSNQTELHQYFMHTRDSVCLMPLHSYQILYAPKGFSYRSISDAPPLFQYLIWPKNMEPQKKRLYQAFHSTLLKAIASLKLNG